MLHLMISLGLMNLLAAMAPGPSFAFMMHQVLQHGRKASLWTAAGISAALFIHMAYCALGFALIIKQASWVLTCIKILGGSYLIYLGIAALITGSNQQQSKKPAQYKAISATKAFSQGFLTDVCNPKSILFILVIWTILSTHQYSGLQQTLVAIELACIDLVWYAILSIIVTSPIIYHYFTRYQNHITKSMAAVFVAFGLTLIFFNPH